MAVEAIPELPKQTTSDAENQYHQWHTQWHTKFAQYQAEFCDFMSETSNNYSLNGNDFLNRLSVLKDD